MKKLIVIAVMLALCGCQEQWGQGDPDPLWQGYFGNSNLSRLNFKQTDTINGHAEVINSQAAVLKKLYEETVRLADKVHALEARPVYDPNECACIEITEPIDSGIIPYGSVTIETVPCEVTERTVFEKKHWEQALIEIPKGAELISVEPTTCRVEKIGIFYRLPGEKGNEYMTAMTQQGKFQAEMIRGMTNAE